MYIYSLWYPRILPINNERPFKTSNIIHSKLSTVSIPPKSIDVIFHSRKSLLYHNDDPWVKKDTSVEFDVTMGSYDGAEVCEIVGLFMLDTLSKFFEKIISIYTEKMVCQFLETATAIRARKFEKISQNYLKNIN